MKRKDSEPSSGKMAVRLALQAMVEQKRKLAPEEAVAALNEIF